MTSGKAIGTVLGLALMLVAAPAFSVAPPPPGGGTVFIDARTPDGDDAAPPQAFVNAASAALGEKGFVILDDPNHAAYVADVLVSRADVGTAKAKVAAGSPTVIGGGVSIPFSTGQSRLVPLQRTELRMRLRKRGEPAVLWRGAAVTVRSAGARDGSDERVAGALSEAAVRLYPNQSAELVGVP